MKVYLDTCFISRVTNLNLSEDEALAYQLLAENQKIHLVTSSKTKQELENTSNIIRNRTLMFLYALFSKIPYRIGEVSGCFGSSTFGSTMFGGGGVDPKLKGLRAIFDADDAQHIFLAANDGCDYFLTLDRKTILSRVKANQPRIVALCGHMRFTSPGEMLPLLRSLV